MDRRTAARGNAGRSRTAESHAAPSIQSRERTVRWPPACRPAPELQREMDAALAEAGVSTAPVADGGFQRNRAKAFEVVRKIRSRAPLPPGRRIDPAFDPASRAA